MSKIKIKYSFCFFVFIMTILGLYEQFIIIFLFVSLHEAGHIISGKIFSLKTDKIIITPIGETAVIKDIEFISPFKRLLVFASGPFINIFFGILFFCLNKTEYNNFYIFLERVNFLLAFFNLLPIYPLDGGRILNLILNRFFPIMKSNKIVIKISMLFSIIFIIIGIIQLILFPYNISLLCIGMYLFKTKNKTFFGMTFSFYKHIINKKTIRKKIMPVKSFYIDKNYEIKKVLKNLYYDFYCVFYVNTGNNFRKIISEKEIVEYIQRKGINGKISDIFPEKQEMKTIVLNSDIYSNPT